MKKIYLVAAAVLCSMCTTSSFAQASTTELYEMVPGGNMPIEDQPLKEWAHAFMSTIRYADHTFSMSRFEEAGFHSLRVVGRDTLLVHFPKLPVSLLLKSTKGSRYAMSQAITVD